MIGTGALFIVQLWLSAMIQNLPQTFCRMFSCACTGLLSGSTPNDL
jgi:hypothetical protein